MAVVDAYLARDDRFYADDCHPLTKLMMSINRFRVAAGRGDSLTCSPDDCSSANWQPRQPTADVLELIMAPPRPGELGFVGEAVTHSEEAEVA